MSKVRTAIKHINCGGTVLEWRRFLRIVYQCDKCRQVSGSIDDFILPPSLLASLHEEKPKSKRRR